MLAALPMRMRTRLQMMSSTLKDVRMANTCMPMYRNTTVSAVGTQLVAVLYNNYYNICTLLQHMLGSWDIPLDISAVL